MSKNWLSGNRAHRIKSNCLAGAPMDARAGVGLLKKLGDSVNEGEPLYRIHAEFNADFAFARKRAEEFSGYQIASVFSGPFRQTALALLIVIGYLRDFKR